MMATNTVVFQLKAGSEYTQEPAVEDWAPDDDTAPIGIHSQNVLVLSNGDSLSKQASELKSSLHDPSSVGDFRQTALQQWT